MSSLESAGARRVSVLLNGLLPVSCCFEARLPPVAFSLGKIVLPPSNFVGMSFYWNQLAALLTKKKKRKKHTARWITWHLEGMVTEVFRRP
jgi:hypothetical protein